MNNSETVNSTGKDQPTGARSAQSSTASQNHDIFQDPALADGVLKDPFLDFLVQHWRQIGGTIVAILVITYFITSFQNAYEESLQHSADSFAGLPEALENLEKARLEYNEAVKLETKQADQPKAGEENKANSSKPEELKKKLEELRTQFSQSLNVAVSQSREPYKLLGDLYTVRLAREEGDLSVIQGKIELASKWREIQDSTGFERLQGELLALNVGRGLLGDGSDKAQVSEGSTIEDGWRILSELAEGGAFLAVPASISIAEIASTRQEMEQAVKLLQMLKSRAPEQSDLLQEQIKRLTELLAN